ncbi:MAG TPA: adenylyl-sulfate kinase [Bacteroidales bacterium]|nr:adenylyl-sulfate kinase [Bacteroidales bacterium]
MKVSHKRNLYTEFNAYIRRNRKRFLIKQDPKVIWLVGLSGAGKTTIAQALEKEILRRGYFTKSFDGDIMREGINKDLGYSIEDRKENIRRTAEIAKIFMQYGIIVICSFITPTEEIRKIARNIIGRENFIEIYVNAPLEICEKRDPKGLYKQARQGLIKDFTGLDSVFEVPIQPDIEIRTDLWPVKKCIKYLMTYILPQIKYRKKGWFRII